MKTRTRPRRRVWTHTASRAKKCGSCNRRIKGAARRVAGKPRCYWCNRKMSGL